MISKGICQFVGRHGGADVLEDKQPPLVYKLSSSQTLDNTDKMDEVTFMTLNSLYVKWQSYLHCIQHLHASTMTKPEFLIIITVAGVTSVLVQLVSVRTVGGCSLSVTNRQQSLGKEVSRSSL